MLTAAERADRYRRQNARIGRTALTGRQRRRIAIQAVRLGEWPWPTIAAQAIRRGESWPWTGMLEPACVVDPGCCALDDDHDGPCAWVCSGCVGSGRCPACGGAGGPDDVVCCDLCGGSGACPDGCTDGMQIEDVAA